MNRLIILGNGFDLAHGLPTSYKQFMQWYWKNVTNSNYEDEFIKFGFNGRELDSSDNFRDKIENGYTDYYNLVESKNESNIQIRMTHKKNLDQKLIFEFKNKFFNRLCNQNDELKWVDIECVYFEELKRCYEHKIYDLSKRTLVEELNADFKNVIKLFDRYLLEVVHPNINAVFLEGIQDFFSSRYIQQNLITKFYQEFSGENYIFIKDIVEKRKMTFKYGNAIVLNFNYTDTVSKYINGLEDVNVINIHGRVNDKSAPIVFGYGDETTDSYKKMEELNHNEIFRYIKSFMYANNGNYRELLNFLEAEKFQVQIVGHSCGRSDRVLLKTIFEHKNCLSIKPFYYYDKKTNTDNFTDLVQDISRHFDNKKLMRERIVNKTLCSPLPQWHDKKQV
jgi:hypothetical protein